MMHPSHSQYYGHQHQQTSMRQMNPDAHVFVPQTPTYAPINPQRMPQMVPQYPPHMYQPAATPQQQQQQLFYQQTFMQFPQNTIPQFIPGQMQMPGQLHQPQMAPQQQLGPQPHPHQQPGLQRPVTPTPPIHNQQMGMGQMVQPMGQPMGQPIGQPPTILAPQMQQPFQTFVPQQQPQLQPKKRVSSAITIIDPSSGKAIDLGSNDAKPTQAGESASETSSVASSTSTLTPGNKSTDDIVPKTIEASPKKKEESISQQSTVSSHASEPQKVEPVPVAADAAKLSEKSTSSNKIHSVASPESSVSSTPGVAESKEPPKSPSRSSPSSNHEFEPISPTPLPDTPKPDDDFIEVKSKKKQFKRSELNPKAVQDEAFREPLPSTTSTSSSTAFISPAAAPDVAHPPGIPIPIAKPVEPVPVAVIPAPVAVTPAPVAVTPAPVAVTPAPVAVTPAPVAVTPAPVAVTSAPVAVTPAPVAKDETRVDGKRELSEPRQATPPKATSEEPNHVSDQPLTQEAEEEAEKSDLNDSNRSSKSGSQIKLKYEYKDDQWSPLNMEGKKQYDRSFLLMLQTDPMSLEKPPNLPVDIVKDRSLPLISKISTPDWMPGFMTANSPRPMGISSSLSKKPSRDRDNKRGQMPPQKIIDVKIEKVELHQTENAWRPAKLNETNGDLGQSANDILMRKARGILNKLCPQKFDKLVENFNELQIDTEEKLRLCMELIFEKAVDEPGFSVAYAQMCGVLQKKQVTVDIIQPGGQIVKQPINFRKLIVSQCQQEFERDYMEGLDKSKYEADLAAATTEDAKKEVQLEWEEKERNARRRSLGNIRFIGELYKLKMLTAKIMHECVKKLLKAGDEESLECLCRLLTTVGKDLDTETNEKFKTSKGNELSQQGYFPLDVYFKEISSLINNQKSVLSSRVRFMLQDIVDLRKSSWKPRRELAGPKTIDQIHEEAKKEKTEQQLMNNDYGGGGGGGGGGRGRDRDNSGFGGSRSQMQGGQIDPRKKSGRPNQQTEDGWNVQASKTSQRNNFEKIDTNKITNLAHNSAARRFDADNIQLGPGTRSAWGQGSGSMRASRTKEESYPNTTNKFAMLNQESGPASISGYPSAQPPQLNSSSYDRKGLGGPSRSMGMPDRESSIESERKRASEAFRFNSKPNGPPSREIFGRTERSASANAADKQKELLRGSPKMSEADAEKQAKLLFAEFISCGDEKDAIETISSRFIPAMMAKFVEVVINEGMEHSLENRRQIGKLFSALILQNYLLKKQFEEGLGELLGLASEIIYDVPKLWNFLGELIAPMVLSKSIPLSFLSNSGLEMDSGYPGKYFSGVIKSVSDLGGESKAADLWKASGLSFDSFVPADQIQEFIQSNKLEFLTKAPELSAADVHTELAKLLKKHPKQNDEIISWINKTIGSRQSEPFFIRTLMTAVAESAITGTSPTEALLETDTLQLRKNLLVHFLENNIDREVQALYALQQLMQRLEHPSNLLYQFFLTLEDFEVITENAFFAWETCNNPAEQEGKGVAISSTTKFFEWLRKPDSDCEN